MGMGMLMTRVGAELASSKINVGEIAEMMERTMEALYGASEIPMTTFKCPSGGGRTFKCSDKTVEKKEIEGVIIAAHYTNVYWSSPAGEGSKTPDCVSRDGISGWYVENGEQMERVCRTCPHNRMGSGAKGRGKACKNRARLLMLVEGEVLPVEIAVPTMSATAYSRYVMRDLVPRALKPWQVSTKVTLTDATNSKGTEYSQMVFECTGRVNDADIEALRDRVAPLLLTGGQADE